MTSERELLLSSLPPEDAGWAEFEANFLGKKPDCPLTADLIALAQGESGVDTGSLQRHLDRCAYCSTWFAAYRAGWEESTAEAEPSASGRSLLDVFSAGPTTPLPPAPRTPSPAAPATLGPLEETGSTSVVLTGIFTLILAGRTQEALRLLQPYLPEVLETVGLDPNLAERLWQFLLERVRQNPQSSALLPDCLRDFARQVLHLADLPCQPEPGDWEPVLTRCALRTVQASPGESEEVRRFLGAALEHGVRSPVALNHFQLVGESATVVISPSDRRRLIHKVRTERRRVSPLFGLN